MVTSSLLHKITASAYVNDEVGIIRVPSALDRLETLLTATANRARKLWDIATLGRVKWFLPLIYVLGWVVTKTIYLLTPVSVRTHWWAYVWNLPVGNTNPAQIYYWSYLWVTSDFYQPLGFVISGTTTLLLLAAYLRGQ